MNVKTETKETCWLCEKNGPRTIGFIGDTSIKLGKDKNNKVAILTKYHSHESIAMYHPNFCPECGRDLTKEEKQMKDPIISYGFIANGTTYTIQKHDDYYSFWFVDAIPTDTTIKGIEDFMDEHCLDGCSVSGTYEQIMTELANLILDLT